MPSVGHLPERLDAIPVFTNPSSEDVLGIPTRWIQLHGEESPDDVARIAMGNTRVTSVRLCAFLRMGAGDLHMPVVIV